MSGFVHLQGKESPQGIVFEDWQLTLYTYQTSVNVKTRTSNLTSKDQQALPSNPLWYNILTNVHNM